MQTFRDLAVSITENAKGLALLTALSTGFAKAAELGAQDKAVIFTESRRTQEYLVRLLSRSGYEGEIVLFNGSNTDPASKATYEDWKQRTLSGLQARFAAEAVDADLGRRLYGQAASKAVQVFELLARRYDVVVANPPYMGSKNMGDVVRPYVEKHYESGKRDLYAAFMLRCLELCCDEGRGGVVVPQPWMFCSSYEPRR